MRVLHLVPELDYSGVAKQVATTGLGLNGAGFEVHIGSLRGDAARPGAVGMLLEHAGVHVHMLGKPGRFDPLTVWRLRRLVSSFRPEVVHVWSLSCLHLLYLAGCGGAAPVVATRVLSRSAKQLPAWWQRRLLKYPARILARTRAEANQYLRAGAAAAAVLMIPPAVPNLRFPEEELHAPALPSNRRFVLCAGAMERHKGFRNAIWTLDILRVLFPDLELVLAGTGPERANLERFAEVIQLGSHVHFVGPWADIRPLLQRAEAVWIPSLVDSGLYIALEAMAAGKPLVASNFPALSETIRDGQTGFLIAPGDNPALGRCTRHLLRGPELARGIAEAGRRQAATFTPARLVHEVTGVYSELAA